MTFLCLFWLYFERINISDLKFVIKPAIGDIPEVAILYGSFIQAIVDFLIIAFSIFLFIKLFSFRKKKEQEAPPASVGQTPEVMLLEEIRDLLKTKQ